MSLPPPPPNPEDGPQQPWGQQPWGQQPPAGGPPAGTARPSQVTTAAVIGIAIGALSTLLNAVGLLAASSLGVQVSGVGILLTIVGVAVSLALLVGGIRVIRGGRPELLVYGAYGVIAIWVLTLVINLVLGNGFTAAGVLGLLGAVAIVALLRQPPAQQWFASRGTR